MIHYNTSKAEAETLQAELNQQRPDSVSIVQCDLLNVALVPNLVTKTTKRFGQLFLRMTKLIHQLPIPGSLFDRI